MRMRVLVMVVNRGVCREGLIDVAKYSAPIKTHI